MKAIFLQYYQGMLVLILFGLYLFLWHSKRKLLMRTTGIDPHVMGRTPGPLQRYMAAYMRGLTILAIVQIGLHTFWLNRHPLLLASGWLASPPIKWIGFGIGLAGLALCRIAQQQMGAAWRVGLDTNKHSELIQSGLYKYIRNPTYTGLFILHSGLFLIWPTVAMGFYCLLFSLFIEIQVRCEEEFLTNRHGNAYLIYAKQSWRYVPYLY
ncbi:MAG: isoprenylcysteine carboxylmethyltransferase family protein [Leptospiraceae bacterium]|nr:isoprenylcysteine carboxylmethyltransferase family protein [Leptospiraceae bacterium]